MLRSLDKIEVRGRARGRLCGRRGVPRWQAGRVGRACACAAAAAVYAPTLAHPTLHPPSIAQVEEPLLEFRAESAAGSVIAALAFGGGVWAVLGEEKGAEYFAGYLLEQSLSGAPACAVLARGLGWARVFPRLQGDLAAGGRLRPLELLLRTAVCPPVPLPTERCPAAPQSSCRRSG